MQGRFSGMSVDAFLDGGFATGSDDDDGDESMDDEVCFQSTLFAGPNELLGDRRG